MDEMDVLIKEMRECGDIVDLFNPIPTEEEMKQMAQELDEDVSSHDINDELFVEKVHREICD